MRLRLALAALSLLMTCSSARAQGAADVAPLQTAAQADGPSPFEATVAFLGGAATGLAVHESGHILFDAIFGAKPRVASLDYGFIPFFRIAHRRVGRREEFVISSAGFWMQYADSEWILSERPNIRHERAPFLKGILAFDLATSAVYSVAAFGSFGPPQRDTRGMAISLGKHGWPEPVVGTLVLAPAVLDGYRYLHPGAGWARWGSRGAKILSVALVLAAGR